MFAEEKQVSGFWTRERSKNWSSPSGSIASTNPEVIEKLRIEAAYLERNAERMRYPKFRHPHLFVGFGVIEAGCKTVIGSRLKQSGMSWTVRGANAIVAPVMRPSQRPFEDYWETRRAA
jgi:hypothetical protein